MTSKKKKIIAGAALAVLVLLAVLAWAFLAPKAVEGSKTIVFEVCHSDGQSREFTISTDEESLRGALEQEGLVSGSESPYGLYVTEVDGEAADESQNQWWCFTKDGEMLNTGVDDTMIADGEHYEAAIQLF